MCHCPNGYMKEQSGLESGQLGEHHLVNKQPTSTDLQLLRDEDEEEAAEK